MWSRVTINPPPAWRNRVMPLQSAGVRPSPTSTANSHRASKPLSSRLDRIGSGASTGPRSRAVTSNSRSPPALVTLARWAASRLKRRIDQSSSVVTMVDCRRTFLGGMGALHIHQNPECFGRPPGESVARSGRETVRHPGRIDVDLRSRPGSVWRHRARPVGQPSVAPRGRRSPVGRPWSPSRRHPMEIHIPGAERP